MAYRDRAIEAAQRVIDELNIDYDPDRTVPRLAKIIDEAITLELHDFTAKVRGE